MTRQVAVPVQHFRIQRFDALDDRVRVLCVRSLENTAERHGVDWWLHQSACRGLTWGCCASTRAVPQLRSGKVILRFGIEDDVRNASVTPRGGEQRRQLV